MSSRTKPFAVLAGLLLIASLAAAQTTIHVLPVAGDPTASGTRLLSALAGITGANSRNTFVLKLDPGVYDVGSSVLHMKSFVDVEGSGQLGTTIRGSGNNAGPQIAVIKGAQAAELRDLRVVSRGTGFGNAVAVLVDGGDTSVRDVTLVATAAGANFGLRCLSCTSSLQNLTIEVTGGTQAFGIVASGSNGPAFPVIRRTVISVAGAADGHGIFSDELGMPVVRDVEIAVTGGARGRGLSYNYLQNDLAGAKLEVTHSKISVKDATERSVGIEVTGSGNTYTVTHTNIAVSVLGPDANAIGIRSVQGKAQLVFLVDHCDVAGGVSISAPVSVAHVGASKLTGPVDAGSPICAASFNGSYAPLSAACL
jgi:hypothetical protein